MELQLYMSHKIVAAAKILDIVTVVNELGATLHFTETGIKPVKVSSEYLSKHKPEIGGYFVVYEDEYQSFSPADAFESGYRQLSIPSHNIARICHEVNRAYCESLGDHSQSAWESAPDWQRESAIAGVSLHMGGDFGPEASHQSWMKQKIDDGWVYGDVKDPEKKTHPCLVPFHELPKEQQAKDFIFRAIVHALTRN